MSHGNEIILNDKQQAFVSLAVTGQDAILIGAAGTGKTTCQTEVSKELLKQTYPIKFGDSFVSHKYLKEGNPSIVICSFTRTAVENIKGKLPFQELKQNCMTIHKLLEFRPVQYEKFNPETQETYTIQVFEPSRNALNPLPHIQTIIIEEASMVSVELFKLLQEALSNKPQFIFLGDLHQLPPPPMLGKPILGVEMSRLEEKDAIIELDKVYRQALESPIISLATQVKDGITKKLSKEEMFTDDRKEHGSVSIKVWKKQVWPLPAIKAYSQGMISLIEKGEYDPEKDMVLIPDNVGFGGIEFNKVIGTFLARARGVPTYEIICRYQKRYFSVGDKVLYQRQWGKIIGIKPNKNYYSLKLNPQVESHTLDYWGVETDLTKLEKEIKDIDIDLLLEDEDGSGTNEASHEIEIQMDDDEGTIHRLIKVGQVNEQALIHAWAITIYKSQGQEWDKVYFAWHPSNGGRVSREAIYTAITRAKKECHILCPQDGFIKGVNTQIIPGNSLKEKLEFFRANYKITGKEI